MQRNIFSNPAKNSPPIRWLFATALFFILGFLSSNSVSAQATCTNERGFNEFPFTQNGVTVSLSSTGSTINYGFGYTTCGITTKANSIWVGAQGVGTFTNNFSAPVNNLVYNIIGADAGEQLTITANAGTTSITYDGGNCASSFVISGNVISFNSDNVGGRITVRSTIGFTAVTFSHNGAIAGLISTLCGGSVGNSCTPPTITCPANITVNSSPGQCGANVTYPAAVAGGSSPTISYSKPSGSFFPVGTTNVTADAANACGSANCSFTVTVIDTEKPVITCPASISIQCGDAGPAPDVSLVTATDNCSGGVTVTWVSDQQISGNCPGSYTILRTYKATDASNNEATCTQTITVIDTIAPTLTVPADTTLQCGDPLPLRPLTINSSANSIAGTYNVGTALFGAPLTAAPLTAEAILVNDGTGGAGNPYDACESIINDLTGKIAVIERGGCPIPANYFVNKAYKAQQAGAVGVIFIFNQPSNNVVTMSLPAGPNPTITIPLMLVSNQYGNLLKAELLAGPVHVSLSAPTVIAGDECSAVSITHQQTITPGNCPSSRTIVNTWTTTDQCGNATSASQSITVTDTVPPAITCPADIAVNNAAGQCGANVTFNATATDNCGTAVITYSHNPGSFFATGSTLVTVTATDACNNTSQCSFTVVVNDEEHPVIHVRDIISCYEDANAGCSINLGATATDNCGILSFTSDAPACFPMGTTTVTWTATDISGNSTTATQLVTRNPELNMDVCAGPTRTIYTGTTSGVGPFGPQSVNLSSTVTGGTPGYTYNWAPATGLSNPNIANPVASPIVTTTYTVTVTDSKGCSRSLSITINVLPLSAAVCSGNGKNVKFRVCHTPTEAPFVPENICISANALNAHLTTGTVGHQNCYLGSCQQLCFSTSSNTAPIASARAKVDVVTVAKAAAQTFTVTVSPNPSVNDFRLQVISNSNEPITVRLTDVSGTVREQSQVINNASGIRVGANLTGGTYFAEVIQGTNRQVVKLIKLR
jgi:HYR domain/PA domain